jgi:hypothetical protein
MSKDNQGLILFGLAALGLLAFIVLRSRQPQATQYRPAEIPPPAKELPAGTTRIVLPVARAEEYARPAAEVIYQNTEEWEVVNDPETGDIKKIIVHRTATRSR